MPESRHSLALRAYDDLRPGAQVVVCEWVAAGWPLGEAIIHAQGWEPRGWRRVEDGPISADPRFYRLDPTPPS